MTTKQLKLEGALLNKQELYEHLEKIASTHNTKIKSDKNTYPYKTKNSHTSCRGMATRQFLYNRRSNKVHRKRANP